MCNLTFNRSNLPNVITTKTLNGRSYWVAPMTMLTVGVYAGSQGPLLYHADDLKKTAEAWNGKPITLNHPKNQKGEFTSADHLGEKDRIGFISNARFENGKLRAEAWIDQITLRSLDYRTADAIARNQAVEISTGLRFDPERISGSFGGRPYHVIARNHRPDHLAILTDTKGACSIDCGCGLNAVNSRNQFGVLDLPQMYPQEPSRLVPIRVQRPAQRIKPLELPKMTWGPEPEGSSSGGLELPKMTWK